MSHAIEFIETSIFTKQIKALASDDELKSLQVELIADPEKGDLIQGAGGLRKVRMATGQQGKSGSARVIYFLAHAEKIYLVLAYATGLTHQCLYFEQPHTFEQILFIQTAEPALVGHA